MYLCSKVNVYKDAVYIDLSHRDCAPLHITYWLVNQGCRQQVGRDHGSAPSSHGSWRAHGQEGIMHLFLNQGRLIF